MYRNGQFFDCGGRPVEGLGGNAQIRLWHPLYSPLEETLAWREYIVTNCIRQSIKQAFREVYLLSDDEKDRTVLRIDSPQILSSSTSLTLCVRRVDGRSTCSVSGGTAEMIRHTATIQRLISVQSFRYIHSKT